MPATALPTRLALTGAVVAGVLLLATGPSPARALSELHGGGADPLSPVVALAVLLGQALVLWLLLTTVLTAGGHLPGAAGRALTALARRSAPTAVRRSLEVALGLSVAVGVLGASPALAATGDAPPQGAAAVSLDWAAASAGPATGTTTAGPERVPSLDWAGAGDTGTAGSAAETAVDAPGDSAPVPTTGPTAGDPVVVQPGDSLWQLAEDDLRARGDADPGTAAVARAWPTWWAANRDAVGDDPDLLRPGTALERPTPTDGPDSPAGGDR